MHQHRPSYRFLIAALILCDSCRTNFTSVIDEHHPNIEQYDSDNNLDDDVINMIVNVDSPNTSRKLSTQHVIVRAIGLKDNYDEYIADFENDTSFANLSKKQKPNNDILNEEIQ
jgi:gluconate kinase